MKSIIPSEISGTVNPPPSKNLTQRALLISCFYNNEFKINNASLSNDVLDFIDALKSFNVKFEIIRKKNSNSIIKYPHKLELIKNIINCGESAFCLRTISVLASIFQGKKILTGKGSLLKRNFKDLQNLEKLGINIKNENLPIELDNAISIHNVIMNFSDSSQLLSGLLMVLPFMNYKSNIQFDKLKSKHYIDMTIEILKQSGIFIEYKQNNINIINNQKIIKNSIIIESDWSAAANYFVAATIAGEIKINGLDPESSQGDKVILEIIRKCGAYVKINENYILVKKNNLFPFVFNAEHNPDLVPPMTVLALNINSQSVIRGIKRLKNKESSRAEVLAKIFYKNIILKDDEMIINGDNYAGGDYDTYNDHRIAMALAIAGLKSKSPIKLKNIECVNKSYPNFFDIFDKIRTLL